jgi:hypothetical protein
LAAPTRHRIAVCHRSCFCSALQLHDAVSDILQRDELAAGWQRNRIVEPSRPAALTRHLASTLSEDAAARGGRDIAARKGRASSAAGACMREMRVLHHFAAPNSTVLTRLCSSAQSTRIGVEGILSTDRGRDCALATGTWCHYLASRWLEFQQHRNMCVGDESRTTAFGEDEWLDMPNI